MKENSKIPAWLQDRKKLIIIGIIILAMIASAANTIGMTKIIAGRFVNASGIKQAVSQQVKSVFKSNKLDGTYENSYGNESMTFMKNGSLIYTFDYQIEFGTYKISGDYMTITLDGYDYQFFIEENSSKALVLYDGNYEYYYEKQ